MAGVTSPLKPLTSRLTAALWTLRGRRRLRRGQIQAAVQAFGAALRHRPYRFRTLVDLATAYLCARDAAQAHTALARAREADPTRFEMRAGRLLARWGFDLETVCRVGPTPRPQPVAQTSVRPRASAGRSVTPQSLPFGDCLNLDEYARFRAMPPISRAELEGLDWDRVLGDLLDE